jgi:hypothetical protein
MTRSGKTTTHTPANCTASDVPWHGRSPAAIAPKTAQTAASKPMMHPGLRPAAGAGGGAESPA